MIIKNIAIKVLQCINLSIKFGIIAYTLDLLWFYKSYIHSPSFIKLLLILFSFGVVVFLVRIYRIRHTNHPLPYALFITFLVGLFVKLNTQGDPIFDFVETIFPDRSDALSFVLIIAFLMLIENLSFKLLDFEHFPLGSKNLDDIIDIKP